MDRQPYTKDIRHFIRRYALKNPYLQVESTRYSLSDHFLSNQVNYDKYQFFIDRHIFAERKTMIGVWASVRGRKIEIYRKLAKMIKVDR